ncbi:hypothetical protein NPZ67_21165 [Salmonella enterica]|nr:hypothetical protein [Salmonella enterica]
MAKYKYSAANNVFYPYANEDAYRAAGVWPEAGVDFDEDGFIEWKPENAPAGKKRAAGSDGMPEWVDIPSLPNAELLKNALAALSTEYQSDIEVLNRAWLAARLAP